MDNPPRSAILVSTTSDVYRSAEEYSNYSDFNSPSNDNLEDGALRRGGVLNLYSKENIGLILNYACVGWVENIFPATIYPFFTMYMNMDGYQSHAASVLITLPWALKTFIGVLSDCVPIMGYRRKPYLILGWIICLSLLIAMMFIPQDPSYWFKYDIQNIANETLRPVQNENARRLGVTYVVLMMVSTFGYLIADVAGDAVMIEFAQREPEKIRGSTQTVLYFSRFLTGGLGATMVAVCFNGAEYGGTFSWSLTFNSTMTVAAIGPVLALFGSFFIPDELIIGDSFGDRCHEMWRVAQKRAVWQLMAFNFFNAFLFDAMATPSDVIKRSWAKVTPFVDGVFNNVLATFIFAGATYATRTCFLQSNWRLMILVTTVITVAIQWTVDFLLVFDVVRSQYFYVGAPLVTQVPTGIRFIVTGLATVEIIDERFEASTYGLITTMSSLAGPVSTSIFKQINGAFDAFKGDIAQDTPEIRWQVAYCLMICYVARLLSNVTLFLLPSQKKQAQELKLKGGSSFTASIVMFSIAGLSLLWGLVANLLSLSPSTECLLIAGGRGCDALSAPSPTVHVPGHK